MGAGITEQIVAVILLEGKKCEKSGHFLSACYAPGPFLTILHNFILLFRPLNEPVGLVLL